MATLYIRDVPDDVADELKARAAAEGVSLSAYAAAQLSRVASRPTNEQIVQDRSGGPTAVQVVQAVRAGRG